MFPIFDYLDEDLFADAVWDVFSVLDQRYVADLCKELLPRLQATFDERFETRFLIIDNETLHAAYPFTLSKREHAEALLECNKNKNLDIAMVLVER